MSHPHGDITALNKLGQILVDARGRYARAARIASDDADAVARIEQTLGERSALLSLVQARIVELRGRPSEDGTLLGAAQKAFLDVRILCDRDLNAALAEVRRGEDHLREEIRKGMRREDLSAETRAFLGVMLDRIVSGKMRIEGKIEEIRGDNHEHV